MNLPKTLPGHWASPEGLEMAERYAVMPRERLAHGAMTDFALANGIFMAQRTDLDLVAFQTAAKERIRWLSVQLALAEAKLAAVLETLDPGTLEAVADEITAFEHSARMAGLRGIAKRQRAFTAPDGPPAEDPIRPGEFEKAIMAGYTVDSFDVSGTTHWDANTPREEGLINDDGPGGFWPSERAAWQACDNHRMFGDVIAPAMKDEGPTA